MPRVRFETADSTERTQIGEGLVRFAVKAGRLETGREGGKYFLNHADGCGVDGKRLRPGEPFVFDTETGEILCENHGERRAGDDDAADVADPENADASNADGAADEDDPAGATADAARDEES